MSVPAPLAPFAEDDACYLALKAKDARFDGRFFTGVTSTGIYCRPVCRVKTPRRENCRFFSLAAQAERAGFRPCLRCRPELAPQSILWSIQDAGDILVQQAVRLLDEPQAWPEEGPSAAQLARRLGVSDRHVRRIFEARLGVSPLQYLQTRRLLVAKQLLADTALPMSQVAGISGFSSVRRFNAAFIEHYGLNPTRLRQDGGSRSDKGTPVRLGYRPPYDLAALLNFFRQRCIDGMEAVTERGISRTLELRLGGSRLRGWLSAEFDTERHQVVLHTSDSLRQRLPMLIHRLRAVLDLDADPQAIGALLHEHFPNGDGVRVPGSFDGFELAVRAVLGQQITLAAARTLTQRLVERFGEPIDTPHSALHRLFPAPEVLARASGDALGQLGIVRQRQAALTAIAQAVHEGRLSLHGGADVPSTVAALKALPGVGDWTAQTIAMRALRWPDAFPAADVALQKALNVSNARAASQLAQAWRPWRSYAVLRAWQAAAPRPAAPRKAQGDG